MAKRLNTNLTSEWIEAANRLKPRNSRQKIVAYVESYDDVFFWRSILTRFENEKRYFEVMLPSRVNLSKGKKSVLMNIVAKGVGKNMIACVDADYDYLMQGMTEASKKILGSPYVFHTYAYAIENLQCFAPSLHNVCVMATLNDRMIIDFNSYLEQFSESIYPLFVWNIWHYRHNLYMKFSLTDFNRVIDTGHFNIQDPMHGIINVKRKVKNKVRQLEIENPDAQESYIALQKELEALGVVPKNTYLYIQGHYLFDNVVAPMLKRICTTLVRERENEINHKAVHFTQRKNELSCYANSLQDVISMLKKNTDFELSEPYKRLKNDLELFLQAAQDGEPRQMGTNAGQ